MSYEKKIRAIEYPAGEDDALMHQAADLGFEADEEIRGLYLQLSEIETIVNQLSPPNFKGHGEVVTLAEKVQWLADRYRRADRYAKASPANTVITEK